MGWFDGSIVDTIARLVNNPGVQYIGRQLGNTAQQQGARPFTSGPLSTPNGGNGGGGGTDLSGLGQLLQRMPGASPNNQQQGKQAQDPLMNLYSQLLNQLQAPVNMPTGIDKEDLMNQVKKAINPIYDARANSAKSETGRATKDVKQMYRALANDYERLAPEQIAQAKDAQKQVESLYGQLRSNITGDYSRVSKEQAELFKSLGIEAALPDVLNEQDDAVTDATTAAAENQAQQSQRYMDMGQMDSTYYREGAPLATMTGNEISTDLISQLGDYLKQVEGERSSGIQSSYLDQLGQAQSQLGQQQQAAQSEAARRQEMLWSMLQGQMNQSGQQQTLTPDTFMSQLPPQIQQSVAKSFTSLQRSPEAVYGKVEDPRNPTPGTFVDTGPEWYMQQADKMLQDGQLDPTTHQALLMYLQLYFKTGQ